MNIERGGRGFVGEVGTEQARGFDSSREEEVEAKGKELPVEAATQTDMQPREH